MWDWSTEQSLRIKCRKIIVIMTLVAGFWTSGRIASHGSFNTKIFGPSRRSSLSSISRRLKALLMLSWWHFTPAFDCSFSVHDAWKDGCFNELDHDRDGHQPMRGFGQPMRTLYCPALTNQQSRKSVMVRNLGVLAAVIIVHELILSDTDRNFCLDNIELWQTSI